MFDNGLGTVRDATKNTNPVQSPPVVSEGTGETNIYATGSLTVDVPINWGTEFPSLKLPSISVGAGLLSKLKLATGVGIGLYIIINSTVYTITAEEEEALLREYEAARKAKESAEGESNGELPGRNDALNQAKRDAGIPKNQQPDKVEKVPMRSAPHEGGHVIKDANGNVIYTREYHYTNSNGQKIIIQEHSAGHTKGGQGPHFNVRPVENPRTGSVPGTKDHYPFKK